MSKRVNIAETEPEMYKALVALENIMAKTSLAATTKELIKIRASQINGCAYCLQMHSRDAMKNGETNERILLLNAWREAGMYSEEEQAALAITEEITLIHQHGLTEETYNNATALFNGKEIAAIIMSVVMINAWNRIAVSTNLKPVA